MDEMVSALLDIKEVLLGIEEALLKPSKSDILMVIITCIYVVATIVICVFNGRSAKAAKEQLEAAKNELEESRKQHRQNAGIQLYTIRKNFITQFKEKNYNDMVWDASILFSKEVSAAVKNTMLAYEKYCNAQHYLDLFEDRMRDDDPELYNEYCRLLNSPAENTTDAITALCYGYAPIIEENGEKRRLRYADLIADFQEKKSAHEALSNSAFLQLKGELKNSIS